ncbi:MAG: hypothetical protein IPK83_21405 [Planctomycetes bacterium]|nr:hypothetical protein [Planctomycetota bacterium]
MWPFKKKTHDRIAVTFVDADSGKCLFKTVDSFDRIPASFEADTTLSIGEKSWQVVEARPMTAPEYRRTGALTVILREFKIKMVSTKDLVFTLPTVSSEFPPRTVEGSTKLKTDCVQILSDEWRQVEWVSSEQADLIARECESIREIYRTERRGEYGFGRVHSRELIRTPLHNRAISLGSLRMALGDDASWRCGFAYVSEAGLAENSFAVVIPESITLYGTTDEDRIQVLCIERLSAGSLAPDRCSRLAQFAEANGLVLVDWCRAHAAGPTADEYCRYFEVLADKAPR